MPAVDPNTACAYVEGGQVRKMVNSLSGLDHLEGEAIKVQMDGVLPTNSAGRLVTNSFTVTSGSITLPQKAAVAHAGLAYSGTIKLLKASEGSAVGTGQTKHRRVFLSVVRLSKSLGLKVGLDEDTLQPIFDTDPALPLYSGDQEKLPNVSWDQEVELILKMEDPLPCYILALVTRSEVEEDI